jgi:hypothetical protein
MSKKANRYKITLEPILLLNIETALPQALQLEFDNHDEIFNIIERVKQKNIFANNEQSTEFALGLKLFSEVMLKNRQHPIFEDLLPAFKVFMEKLKAA